jgi:adenosylhomocysteine nucleosidase
MDTDVKKKILGVAFADEMEYAPFLAYAQQHAFRPEEKRGNTGLVMTLAEGERQLEIHALQCGIGKVNAASAVSFLIADDGAQMIFNAGLSGAVSGLRRGDLVAGASYVECDFDLSAIGIPAGQKPGQDWVYQADETLLRLALAHGGLQEGKLGTGDFFLTNAALKKEYIERFGITAFDMETAAIASVCHKCSIPFLCLRQISDDADDTATEQYREMNERAEDTLTNVLQDLFRRILEEDALWH